MAQTLSCLIFLWRRLMGKWASVVECISSVTTLSSLTSSHCPSSCLCLMVKERSSRVQSSESLQFCFWNHILNWLFKKIFGQTKSHTSPNHASIPFLLTLFQSVMMGQVTPENDPGCSAKTQKCIRWNPGFQSIHPLTGVYWLFQWLK